MATKTTYAHRAAAAFFASAALILNGCTGMPSYEALFDPSPEAEGTGVMGAGLVRAVVIIAKYQASERQRTVANQRARAAYAKLVRRAEQTRPTPVRLDAGEKKTATRKPARKKLPRYIAVDTERDTRSKGTKSIMIWDTQVQEVVGNEVYDISTPPRPLDTARFDTYSAQYVGIGL
jgi:hypothetical protein